MFIILTMAGGRFGYGHLGRCIPIYKELINQGMSGQLISINGGKEPIKADVDIIEKDWILNHETLTLNENDIVLVDVLDIDVVILKSLQCIAKSLFVIDDINVKKYQLFNRIDWSIKTHILTLEGDSADYLSSPSLVPLKPAFSSFETKVIKKDIEVILLTLGGSDVKNLSPLLIDFLSKNFPDFKLIVLVGPDFQFVDAIKKLEGGNVTLLLSPTEEQIAEAMIISDLAISTGGHTMYELAAAGLPTVQLQIIENQEVSKYWAEYGFSYFAGWYNDDDFLKNLKGGIDHFKSKAGRVRSSKLGQLIINGNGAKKLVSKLVLEHVG